MTGPLVSAIVPLYNSERFLAAALDSALAQTLRELEIIVVDDGSTDGGGALADRYAERHPGVVRVLHQQNGGLCHARNAALALARGTYLALLDADDVWLPHHLADCVAVLERRPEVALVHADIQRIDSEGRPLERSTREWSRLGTDAFTTLYLRREHVVCPTAVFRRRILERVGVFDERFNRLGCEDRDLWLRIASVAELAFIDDIHAGYRMHDSNMSAKSDTMRQARMRLVEKFTQTAPGRSLRRRALAAVECDFGDELMDVARRRAAFGAYARALAAWPAGHKAIRGMLRCLLKPLPPRPVPAAYPDKH